jgi:hypothetical protein
MIGLAAAALLACSQEALDEKLAELAARLAKDGPSAKLAALCGSDAGRQALQEKIEFLLQSRVGRIERDPQGHFEDHYFEKDADGNLLLRAGRRAELEALSRRAAAAPKVLEGFNRRADALAARIDDSTPLGKRMKAAWLDPGFRLGMFHRHSADAREGGPQEQLESLLLSSLERGKDGRFRVADASRQAVRELVAGAYGTLDQIKEYEKPYLRKAVAVDDESARRALASEAGILFVLGRLTRQAAEGSEIQIGGLKEAENEEERDVSFNVELAELAPSLREAEKLSGDLKARFEALGKELSGSGIDELDLFDFIKNERVRILLAERILGRVDDERRKAAAVFDAIRDDAFEEAGGKLAVKKGRFVDENQAESMEVLEAELRGPIDELDGARAPFELVAERATEKAVIDLFENRAATFVLQDEVGRVSAELSAAVRREAFDLFVRTYCSRQGEVFSVRPERAHRVEELVKRADQIRKEQEAADKE